MMVIGGVVLSPFLFKSMKGLYNNPDGIMDSFITGLVMFVAIICYLFIGFVIYRMLGYRSYWRINGKQYIIICVENNDDPTIYNKLKQLSERFL